MCACRACYDPSMIAKLGALIDKDGPLGKAAGAVATALYILLGMDVVPPEHWEAVLTAAIMLTAFAPAAVARDLKAKREEIEAKAEEVDDAA